jgi:hypothetical protein
MAVKLLREIVACIVRVMQFWIEKGNRMLIFFFENYGCWNLRRGGSYRKWMVGAGAEDYIRWAARWMQKLFHFRFSNPSSSKNSTKEDRHVPVDVNIQNLETNTLSALKRMLLFLGKQRRHLFGHKGVLCNHTHVSRCRQRITVGCGVWGVGVCVCGGGGVEPPHGVAQLK